MTVPMLRERARKAEIRASRAHIENAIVRGEIKGVASDREHKGHRIIFPVSEGERFLRDFRRRLPQKDFLSVPDAIRIIEDRGQTLSRSGLEKIIDRGLYSGGRLVFAPKRGRFLSRSVLEHIIQNLAAGREPAAGLIAPEGVQKTLARAAPKRKTPVPPKPAPEPGPAPMAAKEQPVRELSPEDQRKAAAERRRKNKEMVRQWLEQNASGVTIRKSTRKYITRVIDRYAEMPPDRFHEVVITLIRRQLRI